MAHHQTPRSRRTGEPVAIQLTERQEARLEAIRELFDKQQDLRKEMVKHVLLAFDEYIPAHHIGRAMDMSEAGARQIRKRRK